MLDLCLVSMNVCRSQRGWLLALFCPPPLSVGQPRIKRVAPPTALAKRRGTRVPRTPHRALTGPPLQPPPPFSRQLPAPSLLLLVAAAACACASTITESFSSFSSRLRSCRPSFDLMIRYCCHLRRRFIFSCPHSFCTAFFSAFSSASFVAAATCSFAAFAAVTAASAATSSSAGLTAAAASYSPRSPDAVIAASASAFANARTAQGTGVQVFSGP